MIMAPDDHENDYDYDDDHNNGVKNNNKIIMIMNPLCLYS